METTSVWILIIINSIILIGNIAFLFYLRKKQRDKINELKKLTTGLINLRLKINNEGLELGDLLFLNEEEINSLLKSLIAKEEYEIAALIQTIFINENKKNDQNG